MFFFTLSSVRQLSFWSHLYLVGVIKKVNLGKHRIRLISFMTFYHLTSLANAGNGTASLCNILLTLKAIHTMRSVGTTNSFSVATLPLILSSIDLLSAITLTSLNFRLPNQHKHSLMNMAVNTFCHRWMPWTWPNFITIMTMIIIIVVVVVITIWKVFEQLRKPLYRRNSFTAKNFRAQLNDHNGMWAMIFADFLLNRELLHQPTISG